MIADIVTGKTATADVLFLIAAIVFGLAAIISFVDRPRADAVGPPVYTRLSLTAVGLCLLAIAWLLL